MRWLCLATVVLLAGCGAATNTGAVQPVATEIALTATTLPVLSATVARIPTVVSTAEPTSTGYRADTTPFAYKTTTPTSAQVAAQTALASSPNFGKSEAPAPAATAAQPGPLSKSTEDELYLKVFSASFLDGCARNGDAPPLCTCELDGILSLYTPQQLTDIFDRVQAKSAVLPDNLKRVVDRCKSRS